jgi:hypothetical protein
MARKSVKQLESKVARLKARIETKSAEVVRLRKELKAAREELAAARKAAKRAKKPAAAKRKITSPRKRAPRLREVSASVAASPFARALPGAANEERVRALELADESVPAGQPFPVDVANNSSYSIVGVWVGPPGTRPQGEDAVELPNPIDRTCSSSCQECEAQHQYVTLQEVPCDADKFDLYLVVKRDGKFHYSPDPAKHDGLRITPTCAPNAHAFICFNPDE